MTFFYAYVGLINLQWKYNNILKNEIKLKYQHEVKEYFIEDLSENATKHSRGGFKKISYYNTSDGKELIFVSPNAAALEDIKYHIKTLLAYFEFQKLYPDYKLNCIVPNLYKIISGNGKFQCHSMDVLNYANSIYEFELKENPYLFGQKNIIYYSSVLHDMCDKKYMNTNQGVNEINTYFKDKMEPNDLHVTEEIIKTMSYSYVKKNGFPNLGHYQKAGILEKDPFAELDFEGVGELVKIASEKGKQTRPDIKLGICGEHGGNPASIEFCHKVGLNYVSCSPYRVPIARLASARAVLKNN